MTLEDSWDFQKSWAERDDEDALCMMDLRRRVEALEARAAAEESSATEPAPAPAADRPLWKLMRVAWNYRGNMRPEDDWAAAIDAVADWLAARNPVHRGAVFALRSEACRAREGA